MEHSFSYAEKWRFFGYLAGYFQCLYGHRTGVYTKMTEEHLEEARRHKAKAEEERMREGETGPPIPYMIYVSYQPNEDLQLTHV